MKEWEKEWDLLWGIAPKGTPKYERGQSIKQFIRSHDKEVREQERERIGYAFSEWFLEDEHEVIEDAIERITGVYPQRSKLTKYLQDNKA